MSKSKKKNVSDMAEEIYRNSKGLSVSELDSLVTRVMERNGDNPSDLVLRTQIGDVFKALMRNVA